MTPRWPGSASDGQSVVPTIRPLSFQLRKFALRRSGARAGVPNQLRGIEATLGLTEKHTENALLCLREQRIRQALSTGPT